MQKQNMIAFNEPEFEAARGRLGYSYFEVAQKASMSKKVLDARRKNPDEFTIREIRAIIAVFGNTYGPKIFSLDVPKQDAGRM